MKRRNDFIFIPAEIIENYDLSNGAFRCFCIIFIYMDFNKGLNVTQSKIAGEMKVSRRAVNQYLLELEDNCIIDVERKTSSKSRYFIPNWILDYKISDEEES